MEKVTGGGCWLTCNEFGWTQRKKTLESMYRACVHTCDGDSSLPTFTPYCSTWQHEATSNPSNQWLEPPPHTPTHPRHTHAHHCSGSFRLSAQSDLCKESGMSSYHSKYFLLLLSVSHWATYKSCKGLKACFLSSTRSQFYLLGCIWHLDTWPHIFTSSQETETEYIVLAL